ncbi:SMC5-SMC6 complex localization factor 1 isoform X1 [Brachionus plicatilis]|uniref:SMC5-SMC6 complex localization factor 1 isoform X1 n=1 Tax=Brachionus plicatilis TaxID=10195 RepID=A0A3M7P906_BRAPC|nr:SMC5-SMC6 complex localization factor 1 isoform X1 [Brachionus plicatilis]
MLIFFRLYFQILIFLTSFFFMLALKIEMKSIPTFQFSSLDKSFYFRLQNAIKKLHGNYDASKIYSSSATHLIVDKIVCTEKILCFIAAGKWIVTQTYIKNCLKESKFLDETPFQVSLKFPKSKLAQISYKWMQTINQSQQNYPFYGWDVAIVVGCSDKACALSRIIRAGCGKFVCLGNTNRLNRSFFSRFTIVIYDNETKSKAIEFARNFKIKYYPFQCIPDYLIQGIKSDGPILSFEYYENITILPQKFTTNKENKEENNYQNHGLSIKHIDQNLNKFMIFLSKCNKKSKETKYLDSAIDDHFMNLWSNKAYLEAFFMLSIAETDKLPSPSLMAELVQFLLTNPNGIKKELKLKSNGFQTADSIYFYLYYKVLSYLNLKILNFPSLTDERYKYFQDVFQNLILELKISEIGQIEKRNVVDIVYLICIHDFLMMNCNCSNKPSLIRSMKLHDSKIFINLIQTVLNEKKVS